ncbi:hypothetical protein [Saccharopolyspora taberi]|uniref:Uncharacterized protein n=1 Tax=Saccharopolyspora taberi TaxID=60895 RepID=A0ABN3VE40_9PSEU
MARDAGAGKSAAFGRIDPFCWVAVVPMIIGGLLTLLGGVTELGIGLLVLAVLVLVFDSWSNRPRPGIDRRRPAAARRSRGADW